YLHRGSITQPDRAAPTAALPPQELGHPTPKVSWRLTGFWRTAAKVTAVGGVGVAVFLALPRFGDGPWNSLLLLGEQPRSLPPALTGFNVSIDMTRTGVVQVDEEAVLHVQAEDENGNPKMDLDGSQRWRGVVLDYYHEGRWRPGAARQGTG